MGRLLHILYAFIAILTVRAAVSLQMLQMFLQYTQSWEHEVVSSVHSLLPSSSAMCEFVVLFSVDPNIHTHDWEFIIHYSAAALPIALEEVD